MFKKMRSNRIKSLIVGAMLMLAGFGAIAVPEDGGAGGGGDQGAAGGDQGAGGAGGDDKGGAGGDKGGGDPGAGGDDKGGDKGAGGDQDDKGGDPGGDDKGDKGKAAEGAPEEYADFKLPENVEVAPEIMAEFKPVLKELNLSQDKAQQIVDFYTAKMLPAIAEKGRAVFDADIATRQAAIAADPEIGGDKLAATKELVNRAANTLLDANDSAELKAYSERFGDCPAFVKLLSRVGAALAEDRLVMNKGDSTGEKLTLAERIYGKNK